MFSFWPSQEMHQPDTNFYRANDIFPRRYNLRVDQTTIPHNQAWMWHGTMVARPFGIALYISIPVLIYICCCLTGSLPLLPWLSCHWQRNYHKQMLCKNNLISTSKLSLSSKEKWHHGQGKNLPTANINFLRSSPTCGRQFIYIYIYVGHKTVIYNVASPLEWSVFFYRGYI